MASFLRLRDRVRALLLGAFLATSVAEVGLVTLQAWRRVPSHLNFETPFDVSVMSVLAAGGGVLFLVLGGLFAASLRAQPALDPTMRLAIRSGFGALMAALVVGAVMIGIGTTLVRGGDPQAAYHSAGAFKLAHVVAMHGIAVLPGLAWLSRFSPLVVARRYRLLGIAAVGYLGLIGRALAGG